MRNDLEENRLELFWEEKWDNNFDGIIRITKWRVQLRNVEKEISFPTTRVKIKKNKKTQLDPQQIFLTLLKLKESIFYVNSTELRYEKILTVWMVEMGGYI